MPADTAFFVAAVLFVGLMLGVIDALRWIARALLDIRDLLGTMHEFASRPKDTHHADLHR